MKCCLFQIAFESDIELKAAIGKEITAMTHSVMQNIICRAQGVWQIKVAIWMIPY